VNSEKKTTKQLAHDWTMAQSRLATVNTHVISARTELRNAENALAKHLDPGDMFIGESIGVWCYFNEDIERVLIVKKLTDAGHYRLSIRGKREETRKED